MDVINSDKKYLMDIKAKKYQNIEKKEIFDAFEALENKILKIKTTIERS